MKYRLLILIFIGLVIILFSTGCAPWVVTNQGLTDQWMTLEPVNSIGQTFVAEYSGLQAINLLLKPQSTGNGTLTMHLRSGPSSTVDLAVVTIPIEEIDSQNSYRFNFPKIPQSNNQYYYAILTVDGDDKVEVGSGPANSYQNGAAYINQVPIEAQLTFSLDYDRGQVILGIAQQSLQWFLIFAIGVILFTIPGWAFMSIFWRGWKDLSRFEKLPLSIGVSLAFYTLFVLATYSLHIQLGSKYVWLPIIIGMLVLLWRNWPIIKRSPSTTNLPRESAFRIVSNNPNLLPDVCLTIILLLIFFTRFWAVRGLEQPMWNDSLHHTEITQLILDNQGLFSTWLPYAAYKTFSMHYGFPLGAALLVWITGIGSGQAVLYLGQVLNVFAPLALFPLALRLTHGNRVSGVIAVLVAGLLSPMPAYYINWGRYAQLGGQVILPVAMWMLWGVIDDSPMNLVTNRWRQLPWAKIIITGGVISGMILFEYRMIFIIITFVIALAVGQLFVNRKKNIRKWLVELGSLGLVGLVTILLFLPWGLRLQHGNLINLADFNNTASTIINLVTKDYQTWLNIRFYIPLGLEILGFLGLIWAIIKRDWPAASIGLWVVSMSALYSLTILHIPWVQYVQSFAVLISLYIPVALFIGYLFGDVSARLSTRKPCKTLIYAGIILFGIIGAWNQRDIANPTINGFVTRPDSLAMSWISEQTSTSARFLIEGMHENWVTNVIGTDGGWWIPLLANRENTIPPQYALANEAPIDPGYSLGVVKLEAQLEKTSIASQDAIKLICDYGITHVYIGQKQGAVGNQNGPLFSPNELESSAEFMLIYHQDRVYIFSVENACNQ